MTCSSRPLAPVSWGEVIDKITILEIKSIRLTKESARKNVCFELDLLRKVVADGLHTTDKLMILQRKLFDVNERLWRVEDLLRKKESEGEFDDEFIDLARSVYKINDDRALLKRSINFETGSEIIEEKGYVVSG